MISSNHIIELQQSISENEIVRIVFNDNEVQIGITDSLEESADNTAVFIKREDGRLVLVNLDNVVFVCTSKRFL